MGYQIHGGMNTINGTIDEIEAHGGVLYIYGMVGRLVQHGGILYDQRTVQSDRVQIVTDKMSDREREQLNSRIRSLEQKLARSEKDCEYLRRKLNDGEGEQQPSDDVLIQRIEHLNRKLAKEREARRKEISELKWRLEAVTDIANGRRERIYDDETNGRRIEVPDDSFDILFTLINEYPVNNDRDMAEEYGISVQTLKYIAKVLRLAKSPEQRRKARERLQRHSSDLIERRGGDTTKSKKETKTKKK